MKKKIVPTSVAVAMINVRCLICRQPKISLKRLKFHMKARHSKLQIISLFFRDVMQMQVIPKKLRRIRKPKLAATVGNRQNKKPLKKYSHEICHATKILTPPSEEPTDPGGFNISCIDEEKAKPPYIDSQNSQNKTNDQLVNNDNANVQNKVALIDEEKLKNESKVRHSFVFKLDNKDVTENIEIEGAYVKNEDVAPNYKISESRFGTEAIHLQTFKKELKNPESDTESCSDNGKNILLPPFDQRLYCNVCGNGYNTERKLLQHLHIHRMECRICYQIFYDPDLYREHMKQHTYKVYACYVCTNEFLHKKNLIDHLNMHYEQEVLESVLNMERDYNVPMNCIYHHPANISHMTNCDYITKINQIKGYLGMSEQYFYNKRYYHNNYNNEHAYAKVICDVCYQELFLYEYQTHVRYMHSHHFVNNFVNTNSYY